MLPDSSQNASALEKLVDRQREERRWHLRERLEPCTGEVRRRESQYTDIAAGEVRRAKAPHSCRTRGQFGARSPLAAVCGVMTTLGVDAEDVSEAAAYFEIVF